MRARHALLLSTLALLPVAAPPSALAQSSGKTTDGGDSPVTEGTTLKLSETATVMAHPDELDGAMRAEATAPTAAAAQRMVNAAMAEALALARDVKGVTAGTGGYGVYRDTSTKPERWQASQTLDLRSGDGTALLQLVGVLQQKGLAISDLRWQLSPDAERKARADATRQAIAALRARIDEAAGLLGLIFISFDEVRLDTPHQPRPMARMMAASAMPMAAPAPPSAEAQDIPVSATVEADATLAPK